MKKTIILFFISFITIFSGCSISGNEKSSDSNNIQTSETISIKNEQIFIDEVSDDQVGTFYLGQDRLNAEQILNTMGIRILSGDDTGIDAGIIGLGYDQRGKLIDIELNPSISPTRGLKSGDSYEDMIRIYGSDYKRFDFLDNSTIYEYAIGKHYLYLIVNSVDNLIYSWGIKTTSYTVESVVPTGTFASDGSMK
ncbi:hypothetical protein AAFA46_06895 [Oscillospiraceae bacterium WX1]